MKPRLGVGGVVMLSKASSFLVFFFFLPPNIHSVSVLRNVEEKCHLAKGREYWPGGANWIAPILHASQESISWSSSV